MGEALSGSELTKGLMPALVGVAQSVVAALLWLTRIVPSPLNCSRWPANDLRFSDGRGTASDFRLKQ